MPFTIKSRSLASNSTIKSDYKTLRLSNSSWGGSQNPSPSRSTLPQPIRSPTTFDSPRYDNGTGTLDPQFIRDNALPSHVKTAKDLYSYQKLRNSQQLGQPALRRSGLANSLYSESSYSERDSFNSYSSGAGRSSVQTRSFDIPRSLNARGAAVSFDIPRPQVYTTPANPMVRGLRGLYTVRAISHVLPGATRKTPYEGHWLHRGTLREIPGENGGKSGWWKKNKKRSTKEAAVPQGDANNVETSGWYSD